MPLEGISNPPKLIPHTQLTEAERLGAFDSRVEQNEKIKKTNDEEESKKRSQEEELEFDFEDDQGNAYQQELSKAADLLATKDVDTPGHTVEYTIKFNKYTELVELIDIKTGKMIQAISPRDLIDLISRLRYTSGLFVDSEI